MTTQSGLMCVLRAGVLCFIQLHLVHWNATRFTSFNDAVKSDHGICVLTVFIEVARRCIIPAVA